MKLKKAKKLKELSKIGQVTLFIIIAIIIVAIVLISYFFIFRESKISSEKEVLLLKNYIQDYIEKRTLTNIIIVASQGGYAFVPEDSFATPFYQVAYWVEKNETFYPSLEEIATNIDFLNNLIPELNLSEAFPNYEITAGKLKSNTTIYPEKIVVKINWPITIKKNDVMQKLENFELTYNIRMGKIYNAATYVADSVAKNLLPETPQEMNLTIYFYENASLYEIVDTNENFKINDQYFKIVFAGK